MAALISLESGYLNDPVPAGDEFSEWTQLWGMGVGSAAQDYPPLLGQASIRIEYMNYFLADPPIAWRIVFSIEDLSQVTMSGTGSPPVSGTGKIVTEYVVREGAIDWDFTMYWDDVEKHSGIYTPVTPGGINTACLLGSRAQSSFPYAYIEGVNEFAYIAFADDTSVSYDWAAAAELDDWSINPFADDLGVVGGVVRSTSVGEWGLHYIIEDPIVPSDNVAARFWQPPGIKGFGL